MSELPLLPTYERCWRKMLLPFVRSAFVMSSPRGLTLFVMLTAAACVCSDPAVSSLFLPGGHTACLGAIGASCTLLQSPEPLNDSCARTNYAQLQGAISAADQSKARQTSLHRPRRLFVCQVERGIDSLSNCSCLQSVDLVFYGDSILKLWKDSLPVSNKTSNVQSDVFTRNFGNYSAAVAGGSGYTL